MLGSPPLARVPLRNTRSIRPPCRITPARAGTTSSVHPPVQSAQDHPRSRGYHISRFEAVQGSQGSPPLARVPQPFRSLFFFKIRITPARAGTTCSCHRCLQEVWDHPRSRGYHVDHQHESGILVGSPPLARVPQPRAPIAQMSPRITPARAGTTLSHSYLQFSPRDHPRSRGYHLCWKQKTLVLMGSPPLARVPLERIDADLQRKGITPARAGTTPMPLIW